MNVAEQWQRKMKKRRANIIEGKGILKKEKGTEEKGINERADEKERELKKENERKSVREEREVIEEGRLVASLLLFLYMLSYRA